LKTDWPPGDALVLWVGAGTQRYRFLPNPANLSNHHATDLDTNAERDYIVDKLRRRRVIGDVSLHLSGEQLPTEHVNRCITNVQVAFASLLVESNTSGLA
jgi:hypothetical protein